MMSAERPVNNSNTNDRDDNDHDHKTITNNSNEIIIKEMKRDSICWLYQR